MDLSTIERAAETLLAPPNLVNENERKQADLFFEELKKNITITDCLLLLQQSQNSFVLFQIGQTIGELILRDWALHQQSDVEMAYKSMLEYVATKPGLEPFVVGAFLKSAAMIVKRGILDGKSGNQEELYQFIHKLLTNELASLQAAGCLFINALIEQFSSAWRNSKFSITWDFHLQAKNQFENNGLRRLLEMSLTTLYALSNQDNIVENDFTRRLCDRFLEVSENILSWNFSSRLYKRFLVNNQSSSSFRPPESWKDLLENDEFFTLFFKLHSKIRHNEQLCTKSMNCLIQLASLTGDCMPVADQERCIKYVSMYVSNLLELFSQGPSPWETNHFCMIINRLFLYRPLVSIMRQEAQLRNKFFGFLKEYTIHLTNQSMQKAIGQAEHDDHASLTLIYDAIVVLLRGRWRTSFEDEAEADAIDTELIKWPVLNIVNSFMINILAPPQGNRPISMDEDDGDETEDRILFNDLFTPLSSMICYSISEFMEMMTINLRRSLNEFTQMATGASDPSRLPIWQEDQHWLMLVLANSVVGEEVDGACHVSGDVFDNTSHLYRQGFPFCPQKKMQFLQFCMENPTEDRTQFSQEVDPFILLLGELIAWSSIEHQIVTNPVTREMASPELSRSTVFALKRFLNAASSVIEIDKWKDYQGLPETALPLIPEDDEFSRILVRFVVNKVVAILHCYGGEENLCQDAIECLLGLVESRASIIATSPELFNFLENLDISRLPNRANLMKALVLIGAAANDSQLHDNMFKMILAPLSEQFLSACEQESSSAIDSLIVDLLQCFDGVALGSQSHSAASLFDFLYKIICQCVPLMRSRSHNETVVSSILQLLYDATTRVSIYIDNEEASNRLYATLLQIIDCYRADQMKRFSGMTMDDEDKASDLVLFIEILSNILSKDFLSLGNENCSTGAKVVIASLEMLLTIMNEKMLQMPEVAVKFFRLILYLVEYSPDALTEVSNPLMSSLCECMKLGMTGQFGNEITSTSLESLTEIVFYFGTGNNKERCTAHLAQQFRAMLPTVFETCLENTCETSVYSEACSSLYSLIAFDRSYFDEYVNDLMSKKSNQQARQVLEAAFIELMAEPPVPGYRRGRIQFRPKMEAFLNKIQGLLSYC